MGPIVSPETSVRNCHYSLRNNPEERSSRVYKFSTPVSFLTQLNPVQTFILYYLLTYLLTYSMEQSPSWEANRFSARQTIPCILWNPEVHYCIYECSKPVPILSQINLVHAPHSYFLKIHFNIIVPSMHRSPKWCLCIRFPPTKPCMHFSASPICATCSAYLILLDLITQKIRIYTALGKKI